MNSHFMRFFTRKAQKINEILRKINVSFHSLPSLLILGGN